MDNVWLASALWVGLALLASVLSIWVGIAVALTEIVVGAVAGNIIGLPLAPWVNFLAGFGAILLTFLAGAEIDPQVVRKHFWSSLTIGVVGFLAPYIGVLAFARYAVYWPWPQAQIAGISLSTTSVAVVYAVMVETGFNRTEIGKVILAACFINDLGTVIALGLIFSPFTIKTFIFLAVCLVFFLALPFVTQWFFARYGGRVSELETKYLLFLLFGLGGLAVWSGSEAVLPAYLIGMVLAGTVGKDHFLIRRLRTLTFGLLTPFYFIRAGSFVSVPALVAAPLAFVTLFFAKMVSKLAGLLPTVRAFGYRGHDGIYYSLMMSTGLTFGTISALFGLNHGIIDQNQYSHLVATVIGSAVIPTAIANARFMPRHLLPEQERELKESAFGEPVGDLDV